MVVLKSSRELELMKEACQISAEALMVAGEAVKPGISTKEIDKIAYDLIIKRGAKPNFLHYGGSSIDKNTGKFIRLCFLDNKVKIFRELYPNAHIDNFYTDSMNDKPMMDIADHVFFVRGNKIEQIK